LKIFIPSILLCVRLILSPVAAQEKLHYQSDFTPEEFTARRTKVLDAIGANAMAIVQGARGLAGFSVFRQSNEFYHLTGIEAAHAYLMLNGKNRKCTLYLPHRDSNREAGEGKTLSAEDADLIKSLTGIDFVKGLESLSADLIGGDLIKLPALTLFTPLSPAENGNDSRDELLAGQARAAADPWDGQPSRESAFVTLIKNRFPQFEIKDLSPTLDALRLIKSKNEIQIIKQATVLAGQGIMEAMRSTAPGVYEYQLDAAAKYIFHLNGARGDGYASIVAGGTNAFIGHYFHKSDVLKDGDLVLMDYAPDYHYYTSDVTRIWPVNGKFSDAQRNLYNYIVAYRDALFKYIKPGVTSNEVLDKAAADMNQYLIGKKFENPAHLKAVQEGVKFRGHFQHPVGMAVHDVGRIHHLPLQPGMVFTIDPMIWIPEERLYIRIEDVAVVTETGVENLSAFVPSKIEELEKLINEPGIIQFRAPLKPKD